MHEKRIFQGAFVASLLLHLVLAAATWRVPFVPDIDPAQAAEYGDEVELILMDPEDFAGETAAERPQAYTAIPDRLASETPPEQADYLALHDALAADSKDGTSATPSADEEWIAPKVEIREEQLDGAGGVAFVQAPLPEASEPTGSPDAGDEGEAEEVEEADPQTQVGEWALPVEDQEAGGASDGEGSEDEATEERPELEDWWEGGEASILREGEQAAVGDRGYEFDQRSMGDVGVGVAVSGDFSLNTVEWEWAPWMRRFENQLHQHWVAPYAYRIGVISGMTLIRIEVARDGTLLSLVVLEEDGHPSLHEASAAALKSFAPYMPLPANFPEENLVITMGLHYPAWR